MAAEILILIVTFAATVLLELLILRFARPLGLVAVPNERSSHSLPTPTGGGLAVAIVVTVVLLLETGEPAALWMGISAAVLALLGLWDDLRELGRLFRLGVQLAAVSVLLALGFAGMPPLWLLPWCVALLWFLNLYNFMDGIDGIAGVQALFFAAGSLLLADAPPAWITSVQCALAGGALGFLAFNWPPARLFLGDVGSLSVGLVIAGITLALVEAGSLNIVPCLILVSAFVTDATWTLLVRTATGQNPFRSHRLHLYQILARRYGHGRTTVGFALFSLFWIIPLAAVAAYDATTQWPTLALAIAPVLVMAFRLGAGRADSQSGRTEKF